MTKFQIKTFKSLTFENDFIRSGYRNETNGLNSSND